MTDDSDRIRIAKISIYNHLVLHFIFRFTFLEDLVGLIDSTSERSMRMTFRAINYLIVWIVHANNLREEIVHWSVIFKSDHLSDLIRYANAVNSFMGHYNLSNELIDEHRVEMAFYHNDLSQNKEKGLKRVYKAYIACYYTYLNIMMRINLDIFINNLDFIRNIEDELISLEMITDDAYVDERENDRLFDLYSQFNERMKRSFSSINANM